MNISIIGTGYVGLVTGVCLADAGHRVTCIDIDPTKVELLQKGISPIHEPGLIEILQKNIKKKLISFTSSFEDAIQKSKIIFMAVGTPSDKLGKTNLSFLYEACATILEYINEPKILVIKSTVPPGTHQKILEFLKKSPYKIDLVSNPEFLREGRAIQDFLKPDRIVIGSLSPKATSLMKELYAPFTASNRPILTMNPISAELAKYACNTYLATRVSFINEMANLSERFSANIHDIRKVMTTDLRIGPHFLYAGCGYGGSCLPKDVTSLIQVAEEVDYDLKITKAAHEVNENQKLILLKKVLKHFNHKLKDKHFAIWGCTFKARTDDVRQAPSVEMIKKLLDEQSTVSVYDPEGLDNLRKIFNDTISYATSPYHALKNAHALILLTEWNEFRKPNFKAIKQNLLTAAIFDGRNLYDKEKLIRLGFHYEGIGI